VLNGFTPLPDRLRELLPLAYNLWWSWHPEAQDLYRRIDEPLWELIYHNPVRFLQEVRQSQLDAAAVNPAYLTLYDQVIADFSAYMQNGSTWITSARTDLTQKVIAYFSPEFGLHESLPIYSGGLGVLAGDHCKEASDLGLPLIGIGFLYPQGYFQQRLTADGRQEAIYEKLLFSQVPATPALTPDGREAVVQVELPGRTVYAKGWRIQVGRIPVFLMDTDIHPNAPQDRQLSARLYGGDREMRLSQEIMLGIGGVRLLRTLGLQPAVWHMNEGHSAFLGLERVRELVARGHDFRTAVNMTRRCAVFTTHTPVPAGNDTFSFDLIERFFHDYWPQLGLNRDEFLNFAREDLPWGPTFSMTVLAFRLSSRYNGVSQLHSQVSRRMWQFLWPETPVNEVPIGAITNGVHTATWLAPELDALYRQALGEDWYERLDDPATWAGLANLPNQTLWQVKQGLKRKLIDFVRRRVHARLTRQGANHDQLTTIHYLLDPDALTIGFARRFATYKRATLLFRDVERLKRLVNHPGRPVQFLFSGKAHPQDEPAKEFIRQVYHFSQEPGLAGRIVFLEDYDINVGRHLVQGVDLWLNNPRRPMEASGTSGQKAALNGTPNLSILDGWWREAYNGKNGWAIGEEQDQADTNLQDALDSESLYRTLEQEVVPAFYTREADGIPMTWIALMKAAIASVTPAFSTRRMMKEYVDLMYLPAAGACVGC